VENPAVLPDQATSEASTPASGSCRSHRILGSDAEPVLQKAIHATTLKKAPAVQASGKSKGAPNAGRGGRQA
jgi:hypothetical protein